MAEAKLDNPTANEAILHHLLEETKAEVDTMKTQIGNVQNDFSKLSGKVDGLSIDVKGLSREIIDSNARTDVYNRQSQEASTEMLSILKGQLDYHNTSDMTREEFARQQKLLIWKALVAGVGSGGLISVILTQLIGG